MPHTALEATYVEAAATIRSADSMLITAGAGMGVDSGLPDFRGDKGIWNAYPAYKRLGLSFVQAANPAHFERDPHFVWGFYGHRTNLYRSTAPHRGFSILKGWIKRYSLAHFIATSNVDGQFQSAGFNPNHVWEVHGSIHHLQCTACCSDAIRPNQHRFDIDTTTMRARTVPHCPRCKRVARPNILMFKDYAWLYQRSHAQEEHFNTFLHQNRKRSMVIIELGAGTAIPTIRNLSEKIGQRSNTTVIRINPWEAHIPAPHHSISFGALEALQEVDRCMG
jgi:NAD-dependent SIR2 family protein deacetylase